MFCMGSPPPNQVRAETAYVIEQAPCFHNPVPPQCLCQLSAGLRAAIHNYLVVSTQDDPYAPWSWVKRVRAQVSVGTAHMIEQAAEKSI